MKRTTGVSTSFRERTAKLVLACCALLFCMAPTPGDVGGCGQQPAELEPAVFFASKANIDCQRCAECGLSSVSCTTACSFSEQSPSEFPVDCVPLVHDGEVCLRALINAGCADYASFMSDTRATVPTECNFCPEPRP